MGSTGRTAPRPKWRRRYTPPLSRSRVYLHPCRSSFRSFECVSGVSQLHPACLKGPVAPPCSENSRRLWLSEIPCWKSFPANFDAAGKFFTDFAAARIAIPANVWAFSGKETAAGKSAPPSGTLLDFLL